MMQRDTTERKDIIGVERIKFGELSESGLS